MDRFFQLLLGVVSFFTVSLGGLSIGLAFGVLSAIVTRVTHNVQGMSLPRQDDMAKQ